MFLIDSIRIINTKIFSCTMLLYIFCVKCWRFWPLNSLIKYKINHVIKVCSVKNQVYTLYLIQWNVFGNINSLFEFSKLSQVFQFLYLYKYFLFQITTNKHSILTSRETVCVLSSHCEWISKQFTRSIWFPSFFLSRNKHV